VADDGTQNGFFAIQIIDNGANYSLYILDQNNSGAPAIASAIPATGAPVVAAGGSGVTSFNTRTGAVVLSSLDVTGALTFTPRNAAVAISLTADVSGVLPFANGGVGLSTLGTALQQLRVNAGATALEYFTPAAAGAPGGADTQVQFNDAGAFGGDAGLTYNKTTDALTLTSVSAVALAIGRLGATNPAFAVDDSVALQVTGLVVIGRAATAGVSLNVQSTAADESLVINAKGTVGRIDLSNSSSTMTVRFAANGVYPTVAGGLDLGFATGGFSWKSFQVLGRIGFENAGAIVAGIARLANGVVGAGSATGVVDYWFADAGIKRVSTIFTKTGDTALANITGLSVTLIAGRTYSFDANLFITADVVGGAQYASGGTATATLIDYSIELLDFASNVLTIADEETAMGGASGQAGTVAGRCRIRGLITCANAGTLTVQFAQNAVAGASSVKVGSDFIVRDNP